jgi:hypothetical protein
VIALALTAVYALPMLVPSALAAGLVTSRSVQMSSATLSATNTSYLVTFTPATTATVQAIILDFCDNDPLVADTTCTTPGGFSITAAPAVSGQSAGANCNLSTFTTAAQLNSNRTLELSAAAAVSINPSGVCTFTLTTVTNPNSANHSFYARLYTYNTTVNANSYAAGGSAGIVDNGGIALSTAALIQVTATVQETMTFCVAISAITANCGGALTAPSITLGHGAPSVLTSSQVDIASSAVNTQLSTNANGGSVVRMKASNTCSGTANNGGLSSTGGTNCGIAGNGAAAATLAFGAGKWGLCVNKGASTTVASAYNDTVNNCGVAYSATSLYGMDGSNTTGTSSTYGSQIFSEAGAVSNEANVLEFVATAANTTPAGIYTGNESLIATGKY